MMKLTINNIKFVKRHEKDGVTYCWYVGMKSNKISDNRHWINRDSDGKSYVAEYDKSLLPKSVQKFIDRHNEVCITDETDDNGQGFKIYMIA